MSDFQIQALLWLCGVAFVIPVVMFVVLRIMMHFFPPKVHRYTHVEPCHTLFGGHWISGIYIPLVGKPDESRMKRNTEAYQKHAKQHAK